MHIQGVTNFTDFLITPFTRPKVHK